MKNKASKKVVSSMNSQVLFYIVCFLLLVVIPVVMIIIFTHVDLQQMPAVNGSHFFSRNPDSTVYKVVAFYLMMMSLIFIAPGLVFFGGREIEAYQVIDSGIKHRRLIRIASIVLIVIMIGFLAPSYLNKSQVEAGHDDTLVEEIQSE